jgi:hypothetical protein
VDIRTVELAAGEWKCSDGGTALDKPGWMDLTTLHYARIALH